MGEARVHSLEALKKLKHALRRFQEIVNVALTDAESEMQRTSIWLETEQRTYWNAQLRKRHEAVEKAKQAVREKQLFKDASGNRSSAVDEMKILQAAQRGLVEAERKVAAIKRSIPKMQKETQIFRGGVQRFASSVQSDLPIAVDKLDQMLAKLEAYVSLGSGGSPEPATSTADGSRGSAEPACGGMAQPEGAPLPPIPPAPAGPLVPENPPVRETPPAAPTSVEHAPRERKIDEG